MLRNRPTVGLSMRDTRSEFLAAAREMFVSRGYEKTTVEAVIDRLGLSKGAFYHHFSSKQDLLDAVLDQIAREGLAAVEQALGDASSPAIVKLNRFLAASREWRLTHFGLVREILAVLASDENAIIRQKMHARNVQLGLPVVAGILRQGAAEGVFDVADPDATAELLLDLASAVGDAQARALSDTQGIRRRAEAYTQAMERIIGAPKGAIERPDYSAMTEALDKLRPRKGGRS